jgi:homeobox protein cut-like
MSSIADAWAAFNWSSSVADLEQTIAGAKEAHEQSVNSRKELSNTTKTYKKAIKTLEQCSTESDETITDLVKLAIEDVGRQSRTTIKAYQEEIDKLTRRCKTADTTLSALGSAFVELQDPAQHMAQLLGTVEQLNQALQASQKECLQLKKEKTSTTAPSTASLSKQDQEELLQLRREVSEYEVEFRSLKNQDITIRKLESKIQELQESQASSFHEQLEKAKQELAETEGRRAIEALEREAAMERKAQTLELQLHAERAGREATQAHFLEADEGVSQREAAWEAQKRILVDDAERVREALQQATRERDELRLKVAATHTTSENTASPLSGHAHIKDVLLERNAYEAEVSNSAKCLVGLIV